MRYIKLDYVFIYWVERKKYKVMKQTITNNNNKKSSQSECFQEGFYENKSVSELH